MSLISSSVPTGAAAGASSSSQARPSRIALSLSLPLSLAVPFLPLVLLRGQRPVLGGTEGGTRCRESLEIFDPTIPHCCFPVARGVKELCCSSPPLGLNFDFFIECLEAFFKLSRFSYLIWPRPVDAGPTCRVRRISLSHGCLFSHGD